MNQDKNKGFTGFLYDVFVKGLAALTSSWQEVTPDIYVLNFSVVTVCLVGDPDEPNPEWVLVDTGLENSASTIIHTAERRFGKDCRPKAIILTHGHFDHVGSALQLASHWDVPIYCHPFELPYVTGEKDYPHPDPTVDEGLVAKLSPSFPHEAVNLNPRVHSLADNGKIPGMRGWRWIHTPGHTEGHISLFREWDRVLLVGDAFTTIKQESLASVVTQDEQISGPPKYLTSNWEEAEASIRHLRDLRPKLAVPSHGQPMKGEELTRHLNRLVTKFHEIALPDHGRFIDRP